MDIEAYTIDNVFHPYSVGIYDGSIFKSFYITDFNSIDEMMLASIKYLIKPQYKNSFIYIHNLSGFDSVYLLKYFLHLSENNQLNPIIRSDKIISLDFNAISENGELIKLYFRDSLNLLPQSLKKLGKAFDVPVQKGLF